MSKVDTEPLRQLYSHLGVEPDYRISSFVAYQLQERNPEEQLPATLASSIDELRDLAVISRDYLQIGAMEFALGLDFLQGGRNREAASYFEAAQQQWIFIDHLPLIALAYFGAGMAHQAAGDYREAAAAYFKVQQTLILAEAEPHRVEQIEAERSLQAFWNDLSRSLRRAIDTLRNDFSEKQDEILRTALGDFSGKDAEPGAGDSLTTLTLQMQPPTSMAANDVDALIFKTVDGVEFLSSTLTPFGADQRKPRIRRLAYTDRGPITIEIDDVAKHAVTLMRWLVNSIAAENSLPGNLEGSGTWFRWRAQPGHMAAVIKTFIQSAAGKVLDDAQIEQVIQVIGHLAELRLNCQLIVK